MTEAERMKELVGRLVVLDTDTALVYVGTLAKADDHFYELTDADVHDSRASTTPRDLYIINVAKYGVKKNRDRALVRRERVISLSALDDVTQY